MKKVTHVKIAFWVEHVVYGKMDKNGVFSNIINPFINITN